MSFGLRQAMQKIVRIDICDNPPLIHFNENRRFMQKRHQPKGG